MTTTTQLPATPRQAVARTIRALKRHRDLTDEQIAELTGLKRATVSAKVSGTTGCSAEDLFLFAYALGVDPHVLVMPKPEALRWVLDNPRPIGPAPSEGGPVIDLRLYACTRREPRQVGFIDDRSSGPLSAAA